MPRHFRLALASKAQVESIELDGIKLSVCIPTCDRPALLLEAVESCLRQSRRPTEILVGDDSTSEGSEDILTSIWAPSDVMLRYFRNDRRLGQAGNVNRLLGRVAGTHSALLHDDDFFLSNGLDALLEALDHNPDSTCIYGMQRIVTVSGESLEEETTRWNFRDRRIPSYSGLQIRPIQSALWCQPPNDAFIVRADDARRIGLAGEDLVGHAVDAHFMIELSKTAKPGSFVLLPSYVSAYRLTPQSIARSETINGREDLFYAWLLSDPVLEEERDARNELLSRIAPAAALDAAEAGYSLDALKIMMSPYYRMPLFSRWTGLRVVSMISPTVGKAAKRLINRRGANRFWR